MRATAPSRACRRRSRSSPTSTPSISIFTATSTALQQAFEIFVGNIPFYGFAVLCIDHPGRAGHDRQAVGPAHPDLRLQPAGRYPRRQCPARPPTAAHFDVGDHRPRKRRRTHDRRSAAADVRRAQCAEFAGGHRHRRGARALATRSCARRCASSSGVKRRFTKTGEWNGVTIIDDYGHHPVEIAAVLKAARAIVANRVIAVVQPHRYTRLARSVRRVLHLFQRCRYRAGRRCLRRRRGADRGDQRAMRWSPASSRTATAMCAASVGPERSCGDGPRAGAARRHGRLPRRRIDHQLGQRAPRRAGEARWMSVGP